MQLDFVKLVRERAKEARAFTKENAVEFLFPDRSVLIAALDRQAELLASTLLKTPLPGVDEVSHWSKGQKVTHSGPVEGSAVSQLSCSANAKGEVVIVAFFIFVYETSAVRKIVVAGFGPEKSQAAKAVRGIHASCSDPDADANSAYWVGDELSA